LEAIYGLGVDEDRRRDQRVRFVSGAELERRIARIEARAAAAVPRMSYATFPED